ncbi:16168_t:CDS:1, partial [Racocetra persica]
ASIRIHNDKILLFSQAITDILDNRKFFDNLCILKTILKPFVEAIAMLKKNNACLYHVLICFRHFSQIFIIDENDDEETQDLKLLTMNRLEKCWKDWEQSIIILSYFLNSDL